MTRLPRACSALAVVIAPLLAFSGCGKDGSSPAAPDSATPAKVTDLAALATSSTAVDLFWTAPSEDGATGTATQYDLRYSTNESTPWADMTAVAGLVAPLPAGSSEHVTVTGLNPETAYYLRVSTADDVPNWSEVSSAANATTLCVGDEHWDFASMHSGDRLFAGTIWNGALIVGGGYGDFGYPGIAQRWNGTSWETLGTFRTMSGFGAQHVWSVAAYDGALIIGGSFDFADGTPANNIASYNGGSWSPLGSGLTWQLAGDNEPAVLARVYGGDLIVGRSFKLAGGIAADGIARWDGVAWHGMARRPIARLALCLLAAAQVLANVPSTLASGEPQESFLYQNFVRASEVLDRAVAAHGGAELLDRSVDFRFSFTGTFRNEGHYPRPFAHTDFRMDGTTFYSAGLRALKTDVMFSENERQLPSFSIVGPANGLKLDGGVSRPDSIPKEELDKSLRQELEPLPHEYLRQARAGAAGLRLLADSDDYEVLCYTLENGEGRALFFDAETHLLMRVERVGHWKHKGDRLEWRTFRDYVDRNGIRVPQHSEAHVEESSTQYDIISEISDIQVGAVAKPDEFTIPAAFRAGFEEWTLQTPKAENQDELLPSHDLGKGAYVIELPSSTSRSLLVAFSDFSVIVESGDYSEISARLLATADHLLPDKPVRYVAMTHHHPLYACGLRPYVQRGITVLATAGDSSYYRDLVTRPYRIHPDEQQRKPREVKFEVIDGTRIIKDGKQRLELHEFDYSTHTDEYVLPYLPSHKLIVTGDMVYILRDTELRPAGARTRAIHRVVEERKLDVRNIMQTWFLAETDHLVPYSLLEEQVRLAEAKDSKK